MTKDEQLGKKKGKKLTITSEKKKAWKWFSLYIRTRDCIESNNSLEEGFCFTCSKIYPLKKLQAGHFIPGRNNKVLFDTTQVKAQCYHCNMGLKGNWPQYLKRMRINLGDQEVDSMLDTHTEVVKFTIQDYQQFAQTFKHDYEELVRCFNIAKSA